jgi:hypothetical protein
VRQENPIPLSAGHTAGIHPGQAGPRGAAWPA